MLRNACIGLSLAALAFAATAPASAQVSTATMHGEYVAYVEAGRPKMAVRKLSGAEKGQLNKAMSAWRKTRRETDLAALKPFADAGDQDALEAMVNGYTELQWNQNYPNRGASGQLFEPQLGLKVMAGQWAIPYLRNVGWSKEAAAALSDCAGLNMAGPENPDGPNDFYRTVSRHVGAGRDWDCGFYLRGTQDQIARFYSQLNKKKKEKVTIEIVEVPIKSQAEQDAARVPKMLEVVATFAEPKYMLEQLDWLMWLAGRDQKIADDVAMALFKQRIVRIEAYGRPISPETEKPMWDYMMATPQRQQVYSSAFALHTTKTAADGARFETAVSSRSAADREWSSWYALKSPALAQKWWGAYASFDGNVPMPAVWCSAGLQAGCQQQERIVALAEAAKKAPSSSGGSYVPGDPNASTQALIASQRAMNAANCARASLGASIICNSN